ncbi:MAG: cell division protein FtsZ, partial [Odoribacter splanchnicus]
MEIEDDLISLKLPDATQEESIIKVIGVGGGGSNAVNHMFRQGIHGVEFVVCNTDIQALRQSRVKNRIQLGKELTEGRGAGCQPERGRLSAIESMDFIKTILEHNTRMVFITAGMGGGTGTGAAPEIARQAKELGILTIGIVTVPFSFEGKRKIEQAMTGIDELEEYVDALLIIANERLREIYGDLKLSDAFAMADNVLTIAAKSIAEIITVKGYV